MSAWRRLLPLLALTALVAPASAAHAQSSSQPGLSRQPPAQTAPRATPVAPGAAGRTPLPYTGAEVPGLALLGLGLLAGGVGLRLRTVDESVF